MATLPGNGTEGDPMEPLERKLTAILYADVAGYSRLTGEDEEGTHHALSARLDAITASIEKHNGTALHFAGDAVLADFATVSDALICAAAIQQDLKHRNQDLPDERKVQFRIGVNLGEVIVDRNEIYGDGVNVAARLESLAEPGGICISESVHTAVGNKLPLDYEFLGEQQVKNIEKPIRAYSATLKPDAVLPAPRARPKTHRPTRHVMVATAAVLVISAGVVFWLRPWAPEFEPASVERMALPLPDKPSIAVLPFANMSDDPKQEYFVDGMTEDLITDLSKLSGLFVIARNSTFTYKGKAVKIRQVAEDLGVHYVLEGSVRRAGEQVRINAQLIDATTGRHVWAERYDGTLDNVFTMQDKVIGQIVAALAVNLTSEESVQAAVAETDVPQAYDALLQGQDHYRRQTPEDYTKAISFFEKAVELDPGYSRAYAKLARVYWVIEDLGWWPEVGLDRGQAGTRAKVYLALALKEPTSDAYAVSADMLVFSQSHDEALAEIDRAIALEPNAADNYVSKAWILTLSGRAEEAEKNVRLAMRLNPSYRANYLRSLGRAQFHQGQYAEAAQTLERAVERQPDYAYNYTLLAATYGYLDRTDEAKAAIKRHNEIEVATSNEPISVHGVSNWYQNEYNFDATYLDQYLTGLRKAGVPEGAAPQAKDIDYRTLVTKKSWTYNVKGATKIGAATAKALHDRGVVFVDVLPSAKYRYSHIAGAANLYLGTDLTEDNLSRLVGKDDEVVFYCSGEGCYLSPSACAKALTWGYTRVYYFAGGLPAWKAAGFPVDKSG
jgi:TolB-like protein/class 3 adenylate cyclase/rhodanese-related sulfurtransferase